MTLSLRTCTEMSGTREVDTRRSLRGLADRRVHGQSLRGCCAEMDQRGQFSTVLRELPARLVPAPTIWRTPSQKSGFWRISGKPRHIRFEETFASTA
jgi:hypothetical protein